MTGRAGDAAGRPANELLALCDPVFSAVCRLNRKGRLAQSANLGVIVSPEAARTEFEQLLERSAASAREIPGMEPRFEEAAEVLKWFVDAIVFHSSFPFDPAEWRPLSYATGSGSYIDEFFIKLEKTLSRRGREADELLAVFYTCLGLGLGGRFVSPGEVESAMDRIRPRVIKRSSASSRIFAEAYRADTRDLTGRVGLPLTLIGASLVVLVIGLYAFNAVAYSRYLDAIQGAIARINQEDQP